MLKSKFERGSSVYKCDGCGKMTRDTGRGESIGVCYKCWDEEGWIIEHENTGGGHDLLIGSGPRPEECPKCKGEI